MEINGDITGHIPRFFNAEKIADFGGCCDTPLEYAWKCLDCEVEPDEYVENDADEPDYCCPHCDGTNWELDVREQTVIVYEFTADDIETIQEILNTCGDLPVPVMDDTFKVDYTPYKSDDNTVFWILGHQIIECIKKNGSCWFTVDI